MLEQTPTTRQVMGAAGKHKVEEKYTWEEIGRRLEEIYLQVLSKSTDKDLSAPNRL